VPVCDVCAWEAANYGVTVSEPPSPETGEQPAAGEVPAAPTPDGDNWMPCPVCGGTKRLPTPDEIAELRRERDELAADAEVRRELSLEPAGEPRFQAVTRTGYKGEPCEVVILGDDNSDAEEWALCTAPERARCIANALNAAAHVCSEPAGEPSVRYSTYHLAPGELTGGPPYPMPGVEPAGEPEPVAQASATIGEAAPGLPFVVAPFTTCRNKGEHCIALLHDGTPWLLWRHPDGQWVTESAVTLAAPPPPPPAGPPGAYVDIVFDGPPSHESGRFVEVEDATGASIKLGEWVEKGAYWRLRIPDPRVAPPLAGDRELRSLTEEEVAHCRQTLSRSPAPTFGRETLCPECGPDVDIDEVGNCVGCGALATGTAVAGIRAALRRSPAAEPASPSLERLWRAADRLLSLVGPYRSPAGTNGVCVACYEPAENLHLEGCAWADFAEATLRSAPWERSPAPDDGHYGYCPSCGKALDGVEPTHSCPTCRQMVCGNCKVDDQGNPAPCSGECERCRRGGVVSCSPVGGETARLWDAAEEFVMASGDEEELRDFQALRQERSPAPEGGVSGEVREWVLKARNFLRHALPKDAEAHASALDCALNAFDRASGEGGER
jgi:hypothetical protein